MKTKPLQSVKEITEKWLPVLKQSHEYQIKVGYPSDLSLLKSAFSSTFANDRNTTHERLVEMLDKQIKEYSKFLVRHPKGYIYCTLCVDESYCSCQARAKSLKVHKAQLNTLFGKGEDNQ